MGQQAASAIKSILQRLDINNPRVLIDLEKQTVEVQGDDYSVDDLLEAAGTLTPERGKELDTNIAIAILTNELRHILQDWLERFVGILKKRDVS